MEFKQYRRTGLSEMIAFKDFVGNDMSLVSISDADKQLTTNEFMEGYVARNPKNHNDMWYVAKKYFDDNLKEVTKPEDSKTLDNTTAAQAKDKVKDILFWGDGDTFKLISKASSNNENWMKSTKAMQIDNVGCVVQVTTQQGNNVSEAVTFVPGVKIQEMTSLINKDGSTGTLSTDGTIIARKLVKING